jgi:cytochrome c-type biogenesis protein CcmH/NrfG
MPVGWLWIALLACAVAVLVAAEWPRLQARAGWQERRKRWRRRRQPKLHVIRSEDDPDEFAASVERDLAQLPTTKDPDRR